jgi:hypothetical protein
MCTGSFLGVKAAEPDADHPPPSSAEVFKKLELYLYSPSGPIRVCYVVPYCTEKFLTSGSQYSCIIPFSLTVANKMYFAKKNLTFLESEC